MEGGSGYRTDPDEEWKRPFDITLSRLRSAPESGHSNEALRQSVHRPSGKREISWAVPQRPPTAEVSSPKARHIWQLGRLSGRNEMEEPPDKRLRLDYTLENVNVEKGSPTGRRDSSTGCDIYSLGPPSPKQPPAESDFQHRSPLGSCGNCADTESLVLELVTGFLDLQSQITQALAIPTGRKSASMSIGVEVTRLGLKQSLAWTVNEIRAASRVMQDHEATKLELPSLANVVSPPGNNLGLGSIHNKSPAAAPYINPFRRMPLHLDPAQGEDSFGRATDSPPEQIPRPFDQQLPPIQQGRDINWTQSYEQMVPGTSKSSYPPSSTTDIGPAHSPIQSHPSSRTLPSPPSAHFPRTGSLGSAQYSPTSTQPAQKSHLQDLQHQISTKTLALQTLQREHDQLLAAFSRSQIRCAALEKKSQVSDHEINTLTEDKSRLQQQVDALEAQVQELSEARDEIQKQSSADVAQWRQIMAMSSQLQLKGAEDARRHKADQEAWERERMSLQQRIEALESGKLIPPEQAVPAGSTTSGSNDHVLASNSIELVKEEVLRVRRRCVELESVLQGLAGETEQIDNAIGTLERIRMAVQRSGDS